MTMTMTMTARPVAAAALALLLATTAAAAPGAHGPNGEHLDAPAPVNTASTLPRLEAHTEAFELVAELRASELTILVDRYESNEPVLGATLEVESGGVTSVAAFRADQGDYVVTDAALLKALAAPADHALVFTLVAGPDSDLLDGTLTVATGPAGAGTAPGHDGHDHGHGHGHDHEGDDHGHAHDRERIAWAAGGVAVLGLLGGIAWWRQRRTGVDRPQGGL